MRNWRVATRLNAILLIPVLVALVLGGFRVKSSVDTWRQADDAVRVATLVKAATAYSTALENERDATVVPLLAGKTDSSVVTAAYARTDAAAKVYHEAAGHVPNESDLKRRMASFAAVEPQLPKLRQAAFTKQLSGVQTEEAYVRIHHPLTELANELGFGTSNGAAYGRTIYALSLTKAAESLTRSIGMHILVEKDTGPSELALQKTALGSYEYLQGIALEEYQGGGTPQDIARLKSAQDAATQKGDEAVTAAQHAAQAHHTAFVAPPNLTKMVTSIADPSVTVGELRAAGITPDSYMAASTLSFDAYGSVEVALADQAANDASNVASHARRDTVVNAAAVVAAVIIAFLVTALMARTMSRSMRRLRAAAFDIAETRLPGLVDQLSRTDPGRVDTAVTPIPINTGDEIGEVARAFDQVHREAVRLAAEQALLRGNVNAIFTNLSQRNQGLIQRQLTLITELENNEADPEQLENLFKMDHLATRMRRNGENLLVLAGEEPGRQWNQPVPLVDVLRAAASEVEAYDRIQLVGIPETDIHGSAVTDLVHLLAELLENATSFSSPQTKVRVTATRLPDGRVMVEIHDRGIGLTAEDFADINNKLAAPPTVDVEVAKRMGLFVVGRLSDRHGIRVQLRPSGEQAGTTSLVMLPEPITHGGGGEDFGPEDDFSVSRIVPEHTAAEPPGQRPVLDHRSAAELGFDDSRYEQFGQDDAGGPVPDGGRALDPVGRSLLREERRAQLEAAVADRPEAELPRQPTEPDGYGQGSGGRDRQEPAFDPSYDPGYQQQAYEQGFQAGFPEQGFQAGFPEQVHEGGGYPGQPVGDGAFGDATPANDPYGNGRFEPDRPFEPAAYAENGYPQYGGHPPVRDDWPVPEPQVTQSAPPLPQQPPESVVSPSLTDAGLPRRERQQTTGAPTTPSEPPREQPAQDAPEPPTPPRAADDGWRSTNDEHWQRAEQVREPKAGGVTPSGLPRRVPQANLVPGTATQTPQGGPQVSRAPEDVRGRLSNLRRGVQQGRTAGTDTNAKATDSRFGGPQNQER
jgi:signal transduction histidine kinase